MNSEKRSIALGAFDGLHRGHRAVLERALDCGEYLPAALTFAASPSGEPSLLTGEDREALLRRAGFREVYTLRFEDVRDIPAETFFRDYLLGRWQGGRFACGEDFRFGRSAEGDAGLLQALCKAAGAEFQVAPPVTDDAGKISSTRIRQAVEAGDMETANRLLGRPFGFAGEVIHGNHLGTGLGTPTLNQAYPKALAAAKFGVYAAWCRTPMGDRYGVTNIGVKPTVGSDRVLAETWLPGFSGNLYGKRVRIFLLGFIRPERKFPSLDALRAEILQNAEQARAMAARYPLATWPEQELLGP